jgi:hypothetical protein
MKRIILISLLLSTTHVTIAETLYSEPHGVRAQFPAALASWQYVGVRFELDQPFQITALHTELGDSPSSFFAALVRLPTVVSFPQGDPFAAGEVVHSEVFNLTWDFLQPLDIPFSVTAAAGAYAVVFGGGQFGSTAYISGVAGAYNTVANSTGFVWIRDDLNPEAPWHDTPNMTYDVRVEGTVVPEPTLTVLWLLATVVFSVTHNPHRRSTLGRLTLKGVLLRSAAIESVTRASEPAGARSQQIRP